MVVQASLPDPDGNGMNFLSQFVLSLPWSIVGGMTIGWEFGDDSGRLLSGFLFCCGLVNAGILYGIAKRIEASNPRPALDE
ncbi:MAG: hypothetical protein ACT4QG_20380 [Sporichthyaceae bacterium]